VPYKDKDKQREAQLKWASEKRRRFLEKMGSRCCKCGSSDRIEVDHIDRTTKVSHNIWSWSDIRIEEELKKCQLLCYECHHEKHRQEMVKPIVHGTWQSYKRTYNPCRCDLCRRAAADYEHRRRLSKRLTDDPKPNAEKTSGQHRAGPPDRTEAQYTDFVRCGGPEPESIHELGIGEASA
jgi:hypothetical protein